MQETIFDINRKILIKVERYYECCFIKNDVTLAKGHLYSWNAHNYASLIQHIWGFIKI